MRVPWEYEEPLCAEIGSDIFFAEKDEPDFMLKGMQARQICGRCLHKTECAEWAITTAEEFGVWGGTGSKERQRIRNGHKLA